MLWRNGIGNCVDFSVRVVVWRWYVVRFFVLYFFCVFVFVCGCGVFMGFLCVYVFIGVYVV